MNKSLNEVRSTWEFSDGIAALCKSCDVVDILQFVSLHETTLSKATIGDVFSKCADKFARHDYYSSENINLAISRKSVDPGLPESTLMNNWRVWYTYKLLSVHYLMKGFNTTDLSLSDKFLAHCYLDMHRSQTFYAKLKADGTEFYEKQAVIQEEIERALMKCGIDCKDKVSYICDVYN